MLWKKKPSSGLPDLPPMPNSIPTIADYNRPLTVREVAPLPILQKEEEEKPEIHRLPSFPDSPNKKGFSQTAIKSAISDEDEPHLIPPEFPPKNLPTPKVTLLIEPIKERPKYTEPEPLPIMKEEDLPELREEERTDNRYIEPPPEHNYEEQETISFTQPQKIREIGNGINKPIFVKLDRFKEARNSLELVNGKISEIDDLLKTIREVKSREDHELLAWEREMDSLKSRISHINLELFEKAETE